MHNKIKYVYHLSDIHIKSNKRIDEYTMVFDRLNNKFGSERALIVVCGDILDKPTGDADRLLTYFLKILSDNHETVIIPGNHDNTQKGYDTITISMPTNPKNKIHHLTCTGKYTFENITIGYSNTKKIYNIKNEPGQTKIGLFHGYVSEEGKYANHVSTTDFNDYDIVCLGDTHKMKFLNNHIAYSGSLIQQNLSEDIYGHGMIKWNIQNNTPEIICVENDWCYIKTPINDLINIIKNPSTPKNVHKLKITCCLHNPHRLIEEFRRTHNILSIVCEKIRGDKIYSDEYEELMKKSYDITHIFDTLHCVQKKDRTYIQKKIHNIITFAGAKCYSYISQLEKYIHTKHGIMCNLRELLAYNFAHKEKLDDFIKTHIKS